MTKMTCPRCGAAEVPYAYEAFVEVQYTLTCPNCGVFKAAIKSPKRRYDEQLSSDYLDGLGDEACREMLS